MSFVALKLGLFGISILPVQIYSVTITPTESQDKTVGRIGEYSYWASREELWHSSLSKIIGKDLSLSLSLSRLLVACLFSCLTLLLSISCAQPTAPGSNASTISWQSDGNGFLQFKTNDTAKLTYGYYTNISTSSQSVPSSYPGGTVTANVKKMSGAGNYGYGIVFCYHDALNFYRFLIAEDGWFTITKKVGGNYPPTPLVDWTQSTAILQGYGIVNTISVTQTSANVYEFYINGTLVYTLNDTSIGNSGYAGFYIAIGNSTYEDFPATPEDVRFQLTVPVIAP